MKGYFQYYETFEKIVLKFKAEEARNRFRAKIISYGLFGIEPELDELEDMVWDIVKEMIDDQIHKRQVNSENRRKASPEEKAGAAASEQKPDEAPASDVGNGTDSGIPSKEPDSDEEAAKAGSRFRKPTIADIEGYCGERQNGISARQFFDYYESKGWRVGGVPMKDWKACVRTWEGRRSAATPQAGDTGHCRQLPEDRLTL